MERIKGVISYIYPQTIEIRRGTVTPYLEITKFQGKYMLNAKTVNYSFGGLHTIFDRLFQKVNISQYRFQNILVLGMGAGSIISLLRDKYNIAGHITAIEKDKVVIAIAKEHFNIEQYNDLSIIQMDAFDFVFRTEHKYDLIITDLFIESEVPKMFASNEFLANLKRITTTNSCVIYNKMTQHVSHKKEFSQLESDFEYLFPGSETHRFYITGSENSLLYFNTLPTSLPLKATKAVFKSSFNENDTLHLIPAL